jgi:2-dehydropantoate 2-reductase
MRIAVIGAGAMGTLVSLLLCDAGEETVIFDSREERVAGVSENGIIVRGSIGGRGFPEVGRAGSVPDPFDAIVLAVPAGESGNALRPISPFVHRDTIYISLQEGDAVAGLAGLVGEERAFAALAQASALEIPGGEVEVEGFHSLVLGALVPERKAALADLVDRLGAAHPGKAILAVDLEAEVWKRLEAVAAVSGLCAISGVAPREAREIEGFESLCSEAARECRQAAAVSGIKDTLASPSPWADAVWLDIKPPMLRDIEAGRKTEVDRTSGLVVKRAREAGIAVPVHSAILTLVKELESGRHEPGENAVRELRRRVDEEKGMSLL